MLLRTHIQPQNIHMKQDCVHVCVAIVQRTFAYARMELRKLDQIAIGMVVRNARPARMGGQSARTKPNVFVRAHIRCELTIDAKHTNQFPVVCRERMHMCEWCRPNWSGMLRKWCQVVRVVRRWVHCHWHEDSVHS